MKKTYAIAVIAVSVLLGLGLALPGFLFLCAAMQEPARFLVALPLLVVGGIVLIGGSAWGGATLRRLRDLDPENLGDRVTELARAGGNAEVTLSQVVAELGVPDEAAIAALNLLERRGQCHREMRGEREVYSFPGLKTSLVRRRCPYCGAEFSVKKALHQCPQCGGNLELERE